RTVTPLQLPSFPTRRSSDLTSKHESIVEAADILITHGYVHKSYKEKMFEREESVSTFMGNGLAIPHGTDEAKDDVIQSRSTPTLDRKSTRLNSRHVSISYAV